MHLSIKPFLFLIITLLFLSFESVHAQSVELWGFGGYTFRETFDVNRGEVEIQAGPTWGGSVTFDLNPSYGIEVFYSYQDTEADVRTIEFDERDIPISAQYIQVGGMRYFPLSSEAVVLYAGLNIGAGGLVPENKNGDSWWQFAPGVKFGSKFYFSERIGLRVQGILQSPMQFAGTGFYIGTGGVDVGVNSFSTILQFGFQGGIVVRLN